MLGIFSFIADLFVAIIKAILGFVAAVINWARKNPREALIVVGALVLVFATWYFTSKYVDKKAQQTINILSIEVQKANDDRRKRDEKIAALEKDSKKEGETLAEELKKVKSDFQTIVSRYEKRLAEEKKKNVTVAVPNPTTGKATEVMFDQQGRVVCERLTTTYKETVNEMLDKVNQPLGLLPSKSLK